MPILRIRAVPAGREEGTPPPPPGMALWLGGPCTEAEVGLLEAMVLALREQGQQVPQPRVGRIVIDTGATMSAVDEKLAAELGLSPVGQGFISSVSHAAVPVNLYPVTVKIVGAPLAIHLRRAAGLRLEPLGLAALVGRDALRHCMFVYSGPFDEWVLAL